MFKYWHTLQPPTLPNVSNPIRAMFKLPPQHLLLGYLYSFKPYKGNVQMTYSYFLGLSGKVSNPIRAMFK